MGPLYISALILISITIVYVILELRYIDMRDEIKASIDKFNQEKAQQLKSPQNQLEQFYDSDAIETFEMNITGYPFNIVPNIVHYILFNVDSIEFAHYISILSVLKNQRPDIIYIHCDCNHLKGDYYKRIMKVVNKTNTNLIVRPVVKPTEIFGHKLTPDLVNWHGADITRIRVLMEFGGIYMDRDVYLVQSLDKFRKYELTLDFENEAQLVSQVVVTNKHARFLAPWLDCYHDYFEGDWTSTLAITPVRKILNFHPEYFHRLNGEFGSDDWRKPTHCPRMFTMYYENWQKDYYAFHLHLRGTEISYAGCYYYSKNFTNFFDENSSKNLNTTFGEMIRVLLSFENKYN